MDFSLEFEAALANENGWDRVDFGLGWVLRHCEWKAGSDWPSGWNNKHVTKSLILFLTQITSLLLNRKNKPLSLDLKAKRQGKFMGIHAFGPSRRIQAF